MSSLFGEFGEGAGVAFGRWGGEGILDGGAVATHIDGVHDREGAADAEEEAEKAADRGGPEGGGHRASLAVEWFEATEVCPSLRA